MRNNAASFCTFVVAALGLFADCAWSQSAVAILDGVVTKRGQPESGSLVLLTNKSSGKQWKAKTEQDGHYRVVGLPTGDYQVQVYSGTGELLYGETRAVTASGSKQTLNLELGANAALEKAQHTNLLITQATNALNARDYAAAAQALRELEAAEPARYEFPMRLGDAELRLGQFEDAARSYERAIKTAEKTQPDSKNPATDPAKVKTAIGDMLVNQGNAYLKLDRSSDAITAFTRAAAVSPKPATAYFNLCAAHYNSGAADAALAACDKTIAADPGQAMAYFLRGALLVDKATVDANGKYRVPAGAEEALKKYLEIAPNGPRAADANKILAAIASAAK